MSEKLQAARRAFDAALRRLSAPELDEYDDVALRAAICYYRLAADESDDPKEQVNATEQRLLAEEAFRKKCGRAFDLYEDFISEADVTSAEP